MSKEDREDFNCSANIELHQGILAARRAGRRYGKRLISCTLAFELGAKILLGLEDNEEEKIQQDLDDLTIKESEIAQKKRLRLEQLKMMQASKVAKMEQAAEQNDNVQTLAQRIIEVWDNIVIYKKYNLINSLVDIDKTKLNRPKLEAIFPKRITPKPSQEVAIKIAYELLEGEYIGA